MKKNEIVKLDIVKTASDGRGIAYLDGKICFVYGTLAGETVEARIFTEHKSYITAGANKILTSSPTRQTDYCCVSSSCGGCPLSHIKYQKQLELKRQHIIDTLKRIGKIENADNIVCNTIGMNNPKNYRNKMVFPVGEKNGCAIGGFYESKSHDIVELTSCATGEDCATKVLSLVLDFMNEEKIPAYNEKTASGFIRRVFVRTGYHSRDLMIVISCANEKIKNLDKLVSKFTDSDFCGYNLKSIILNVNSAKNNLVLGDKNITLWGTDTISDSILDLDFNISPHSFFQVNPTQTEILYKKALEYADLDKEKTVLDIYCGIGTISLCAAKCAKMVIGIEIVDAAISDAKKNAQRNNLNNTEFYCGAAENIVPKIIITNVRPDVVIIDPPRKGSDEKTLSAITSSNPEKIIYVSCNPATLARDAKFLCENGYKLVEVTPVDMFPNTEHIESASKFERS